MSPVLITMAVVLVVAVLALVYAAFPHRGESIPGAPWLGDVLERASDAVPTVADGDLDPVDVPVDVPADDGASHR
ncbi:hypothetical protein [Nocardioides sp.]|uniref:hypothetical protein n=1 Tax=Nocardioides sp. TaxID=35761 RepID=UPI0027196B8F|nr:hypothetical protein [Nocardioides sp.]MDO9457094.1 hypothetical protein [Nocardioides sp.]